MTSLIIGFGEVGKALFSILKSEYQETYWYDLEDSYKKKYKTYDLLHICFPYSESFIEEVERYKNEYSPKHTIIHSTVPVGTSRILGAIHSPIRGIHPNLEEGIRTFPKFIGGSQASEVTDYFRRTGIKIILCDTQETTEAMKLFDTLYFGVCIEFVKEVKRYCNDNGLNFSDVYRIANQTYNEGYSLLGHKEYVRPILEPIMKKIGGHCVRENVKLLKTPFADFIEDLNNRDYAQSEL